MKTAIVYDRINKWGGAERVLLALHKMFPQAPIYTSVFDNKNASWSSVFRVKPSFLQKIPKAKNSHELFAPLMPFAFESFSFEEYDLVISVTSEASKAIVTKPQTLHICICLTPTRYLWSGYSEYFKNRLLSLISKPLVSYLRFWDKIVSSRPDYYIAISREVQSRIKKYYSRDSKVIYPPVDLAFSKLVFSVQYKEKAKLNANQLDARRFSYFLVVSRLVPYKRIDLAIKAANNLSVPLKIIGKGREFKKLKKISGKTIEFIRDVSDDQLINYYKNCKALIFPGIEDFGLVMVEAQACGKPVIAFREGGAREIIREGITGEFFNEQNTESLTKVLKNFDNNRYNSKNCIENAKRFSFRKFEKELSGFINSKLKERFDKV
ncbi:glycosyltransferase family 4 protein [Candidatus Parcubacteria bacterium]|nr:MAG: glycosyltransferase family 4 protein [Candidatus Parcubacteria bacterium]